MTSPQPATSGLSDPAALAAARARRHQRVARAVIAAIAVALGVAQGVVWARIAPGEQVLVYADGSYIGLPTADYHPFDGLALLAFAGAGVGVVVAFAAWRVRAIRGAGTLLTVVVSAAVGGAVAYLLGIALAGGVDPASVGKTDAASVVLAGADPGSPLVMIIEPLVAVALYTFLAAWDGRPDLGATRASRTEAATPAAVSSSVSGVAPPAVGSDEGDAGRR